MGHRMVRGCFECGKDRERCEPSYRDVNGVVKYICPQCARKLEYDRYVDNSGEDDG